MDHEESQLSPPANFFEDESEQTASPLRGVNDTISQDHSDKTQELKLFTTEGMFPNTSRGASAVRPIADGQQRDRRASSTTMTPTATTARMQQPKGKRRYGKAA
jgi:hypothetical protein